MRTCAEGGGGRGHDTARCHKRWADLTRGERVAVIVLASVELSLTATAAVDLFHRPKQRLRGRKALWWPVLVIQPFGPIIYLIVARRAAGARDG